MRQAGERQTFTQEKLTNVGGIAEMSSLQITGHLNFQLKVLRETPIPKEEIWLLRLSVLLWGQKPGTLPVLIVPPRDVLQNISNSNGFHYLMISNIMHRNEN